MCNLRLSLRWVYETKFPIFRSKYRLSVKIDKISPSKFRFSDFFRYFSTFSELKMLGSDTLQPPNH